MTSILLRSALFLTAAVLPLSCGDEAEGHGAMIHGEDTKVGPHGGDVMAISGGLGHMEIAHDEHDGTLAVHMLAADATAALPVEKAPVVKLGTEDGPVDLPMTAGDAPGSFHIKDERLAKHTISGQVEVEIAGKAYLVEIPHVHH